MPTPLQFFTNTLIIFEKMWLVEAKTQGKYFENEKPSLVPKVPKEAEVYFMFFKDLDMMIPRFNVKLNEEVAFFQEVHYISEIFILEFCFNQKFVHET